MQRREGISSIELTDSLPAFAFASEAVYAATLRSQSFVFLVIGDLWISRLFCKCPCVRLIVFYEFF